MNLVQISLRATALAATLCVAHASAWALSTSDFKVVAAGTAGSTAVDLNDRGQILVSQTNGFKLVTLNGTETVVDLSAFVAAGNAVSLGVMDLSNAGHVVGRIYKADNTSSPFFWSAATGPVVVPGEYASRVNDSGTTVGPAGTWSVSGGAVPLSTLVPDPVAAASVTLLDIDNQGQIAFQGPYVPQTMNSASRQTYGVMSAKGDNISSYVIYDSSGIKYFESNKPDLMRFNGAGSLLVSWDGDVYHMDKSTVYNLATQGSVNGTSSTKYFSINPQNQALGCNSQYGGPINDACNYYEFDSTAFLNLGPLVSLYGRPVAINASGQVLFSNGTVLQGPTLSGTGTGTGGVQPGTGAGLKGQYFNAGLAGNKLALTRIENPNFDWGTASPGPGVRSDFFVAKWTGFIETEEAGAYTLQTLSDEGVRVTVDGKVVIDNWKGHKLATNKSAALSFEAGKRHSIVIDYYDLLGPAVMRLQWIKPGATAATAVPTTRLYAN